MKLKTEDIGEVYHSLTPELQAGIVAGLLMFKEGIADSLERGLLYALSPNTNFLYLKKASTETLIETLNFWKKDTTGRRQERSFDEEPLVALERVLADSSNLLCPFGSITKELQFLLDELKEGESAHQKNDRRDSIKTAKGSGNSRLSFKLFRCNDKHVNLFRRLERHSTFFLSSRIEAECLIRSEEMAIMGKGRKEDASARWSMDSIRHNQRVSAGRRLPTTYCLQPAGRLQERTFGIYRLSEKATNLRRSLLRDSEGNDLHAFDCASSGWLLAAVLMGDRATYDVVQKGLNDVATVFALEHGLISSNEKGEGRKAIKKLMMTHLYGSTARNQYKDAQSDGELRDVWTSPEAPAEFLGMFGSSFPTFNSWLAHCQTMHAQARWTWTEPYSGIKIDAFRPEVETYEVSLRLRNEDGKLLAPIMTRVSQLPSKGVAADVRKIGNALAPVIIHSLDAALLKFTLEYLLDRATVTSVISPIHDCIVVSQDLVEHVQDAWNHGLRCVVDRLPALRDEIGLNLEGSGIDGLDLNVKLSKEY